VFPICPGRAVVSDRRLCGGYGRIMDLTETERVLLNNALNEVLNGPSAISAPGFQSRMGGTRAEVEALLERIHSEIA
jgi:hypothetical protein